MKAVRTPLLYSKEGIFLKPENLQPGGSYKIRGVQRIMKSRFPAQGLSTVSAGNLGRSLAMASEAAGIHCTIYLPDSAPLAKKEKILQHGAKLIELPFPAIWNMLLAPPGEQGFIHPIQCQELRLGYGEIASEIAEQLPDIDVMVLPFGLGGLALGVATAMRALRPEVRVFAAELEHQAPLAAAFEGRAHAADREHAFTFVDAIGTPELLPGVLMEARRFLSGSVVVTLAETRNSLRLIYDQHGLVVEGAAAVAHAAALRLGSRQAKQKITAVLSGGNIASELHAREYALAGRKEGPRARTVRQASL